MAAGGTRRRGPHRLVTLPIQRTRSLLAVRVQYISAFCRVIWIGVQTRCQQYVRACFYMSWEAFPRSSAKLMYL